MRWVRCFLLVIAGTALASCRLAFETQGTGFIYAETAAQVYRNGRVLEINEDFDERFHAIPFPGRQFARWHFLCANTYAACPLQVGQNLWARDQQFPLRAEFTDHYAGPLKLVDFDLWWYPQSREWRMPANSVAIAGIPDLDEARFFMATIDRKRVIPGTLRGGDYVFPLARSDDPDDFWPFISARDRDGLIASASIDLRFQELAAAELHPYNSTSRWAEVLHDCAAPQGLFDLCNFDTLPFIGGTTDTLAVTDIMQRTLVSHAWMGKRLREVLLELPPELLQMFRSVTSVVISSEIRPSFYSPATGAIYLDPDDLWLTPTERRSISSEPDYREEYGSVFRFFPFWLYVEGRTEAWIPSAEWPDGVERSVADILRPMATLLIHELTHANDSVPAAQLVHTTGNATPLDMFSRVYDFSPSAQLAATYPLASALLYELADSLYYGAAPGSNLLQLTARDVGLEFGSEYANDLYAFSSRAEDTAMLVEEVLSNHFFGIERIVAFVDDPGSDYRPTCDDYTLRWGRRNRVFDPAIKQRARLVMADILDDSDLSAYLDDTPAQQALTAGQGLCDYFDLRTFDSASRGQSLPLPQRVARQREQVSHHRNIQQVLEGRHKVHSEQ
ncbi:hypothetical protein [Haliea sp. E17]|uniref:hypothetical protein n=1 Tax=Haliea sp. E17 TaxID=3401576 RepID=UPI003AAA33EC